MSNDARNIFVADLESCGEGLRVAIKDSIDVEGVPTRLGSAVFNDAPQASKNAAVIDALKNGGCCLVGKTNMHEFAYGVTGINARFGTPLNPNYPKLAPGGSSSGSAAAVAAGLADFSLGTDTGGSVRIPAACCGLFGLKPTFGRVSRDGVHPQQSSLDCVGAFASDLKTLEAAMSLIDPTYLIEPTPVDPILGVVDVEASPEIWACIRRAVTKSGLRAAVVGLEALPEAFRAGLTLMGWETWAAFGDYVTAPELGDDIRTRLTAASGITAAEAQESERVRTSFSAQVDALLETVDALVLPTMPVLPVTLEEAADAKAAIYYTALVRPFNLSGHPALTLPIGEIDGRPVGLQLVGKKGGDAALCAIARRFQTHD